MGVVRTSLNGNDYIGAYATATEEFVLVGPNIQPHKEELIAKELKAKVIKATIDGSDLLGIYTVANSRCILIPELASETEVARIKAAMTGVEVYQFRTNLNALGNNILANDKMALVNPEYNVKERKIIGDLLGVEVLDIAIGGFSTIGASNLLTNTGIVLNNRASDEEIDAVKKMLDFEIVQTTANTGSPNIGICAFANSKGLVVGEKTSGFELARLAQGLGF